MLEIGAVFEKYGGELEKSMTAFCGKGEVAADAVGQAFLKAVENRRMLELMPEPAAKAWLFATARNCIVDYFRKQKRVVYAGDELLDTVAADMPDRDMEHALTQLPETEQAIVRLRYYGGYRSHEIGAMLDIPPSTVRYRLAKAIRQLRSGM
ncbi:MAG: RNA polymerase sigma factor [Oscillospiraceae bacterium]